MKTIQPPAPPPAAVIPTSNNVNQIDHTLVGQAVTCVIDGIFDNGYLLSTRMGPNNTILRGIVFQQGHICPVMPANDVAPHVEMCTRGEFPIPPSNPRNQIQFCTPESACAKQTQPVAMQNYQNTPSMVTGGSSTSAPQESLRLVEQDDVMQVFEVSKAVEDHQERQDCDQRAKNDHVVGSDPTAESFPESGTMIQGVQIQAGNLNSEFTMAAAIAAPQATESLQPVSQDMVQDEGDHKAMEREPVVNDASPNEPCVNELDGKNPEVITPVEPVMEIPPSMGKDGVHQESKEQTGEVSNVDANQDPSREVAVDLSLSNFHEI
ncbi:hypothetical protein L6452_31237 [Arctium lappa]|uniref:Uncharacterized protein n=1 Tax=Arctium lappa TaxID=4217 RepID=A0ACB8ZPR9_ARCLA|nr:hypothetical protein L6452_31237 [Arctium lappa]